ncbi:MAG: glycosyltransferase family 9 protein [Deltaproteobacteria bacterium]|nr:glycosyltransferase family 9 protein [Deltaproteobacteria bacterium]
MTLRRDVSRTVVVMLGGIGNMVLLTPALQRLAEAFPGVTVDAVLSSRAPWEVVERAPFAGCPFVLSGRGSLLRLVLWLRRPRIGMLLVSTGHNPKKAARLARLSGATVAVGEGVGPWSGPTTLRPEVSANLEIVDQVCPASPRSPAPRVWTTGDDEAAAERFLAERLPGAPRVALHLGCGAAMAYKRWSVEGFHEVGRRLLARGVSLLVVAGPDEAAEVEASVREVWGAGGRVAVAGTGVALRTKARLLARCDALVSNDSGPMHLAAAVGTPCVAVFGPTDPARFGPWGPGHCAVEAPLPCRPCYPEGTRCTERPCLTGVPASEVWAALESVLQSPRPRTSRP